jgi:hypothetical protein
MIAEFLTMLVPSCSGNTSCLMMFHGPHTIDAAVMENIYMGDL